jgi:hypothetical protein
LSKLGVLVEMRVYAENAQVKLNQRGCERMDFVVGFKPMASKIPADPLLNRRMCLGWCAAIHHSPLFKPPPPLLSLPLLPIVTFLRLRGLKQIQDDRKAASKN